MLFTHSTQVHTYSLAVHDVYTSVVIVQVRTYILYVYDVTDNKL